VKKVVVFGAGLVARAHVHYLLERGFQVTVASRTVSKAEALVEDHPSGHALAFDIAKDGEHLEAIVMQHDLAVSLLPYRYHPQVAQACIKHGKHMVTTSYVKEAMQALDGPAKEAGVTILNEIGVDPGIDHMMSMQVIHRVQAGGGKVVGFTSYAGGLPAPEANDNPFGYKFSWSPKGVLLAGKNNARFRRDGAVIEVPGPELFDHYWDVPVEVEGKMINFEGYPNRDSLPYAQVYGINASKDMFRGTLRNEGWCGTMKKMIELGLLGEKSRDDLAGLTYAQFLARLIGQEDTTDLKATVADRLSLALDSYMISNMEWLGLFGDKPLPKGKTAPIDIMAATMLDKMQYNPGERDMLVLQHEFLAEYPDRTEKTTSTMIDFGIPHGDTSMARTVGLPAAIGVRMILEREITSRGVLIPVTTEIYDPVLEELGELGIQFSEKVEVLP
jgi:saccharopine dehydrogenase (NADP+, L-glutamate forming)/spermidine synthase